MKPDRPAFEPRLDAAIAPPAQARDAWLDSFDDSRAAPGTSRRRLDVQRSVETGDSALLSAKVVKGQPPKVYADAPHGLVSTHREPLDADLLAFIEGRVPVGPLVFPTRA